MSPDLIPRFGVLIAFYASSLLLLTVGGNAFCRMVIYRWSGVSGPEAPARPTSWAAAQAQSSSRHKVHSGRVIGTLERLLIMLGITVDSWEVIVAVIALKTAGRVLRPGDDRVVAEYVLIGSLASILWAIGITMITLYADRTFGLNISAAALALKGD